MLGLDEDAYRSVVARAVQSAERVRSVVDEIHSAGYDSLYLIGSGGSYGAMLGYEALMRETSLLPTRACIAAELVLAGDRALGPRSVAVLSSLSGTTRETLEAAAYCRERGATTIGLTGDESSPLARSVDHVIVNEADNSAAAESIYIQLTLLVTRMLSLRGEFADWATFARQLEVLPDALVQVNAATDAKAAEFAAAHRETEHHFVVGAGRLWGQAYNYSMCVLEEMQWLHTTRVHGAEFFHGSLELVEKGTSMLLLFGEDAARPLMDRVLSFATTYSGDVTVVDSRDYPLTGIDEQYRGLLSPLVVGAACTRISKHLEAARDHSLDLRRYYRVVEY